MKPRRVVGEGTAEEDWQAWPDLQVFPITTLAQLVPAGKRVVIIAPHPDDEILMAGGLLQQLQQQGNRCLLIAVSDGEASHPGSTIWSPERLRCVRPAESLSALQELEILPLEIRRLGLPDGALSTSVQVLHHQLSELIGPEDVVFATWRLDGHPDHEICGTVAAEVASIKLAKLVEVPVWMWHWATPADPRVPWAQARRLLLDAQQVVRKQTAIAAFQSQLGRDVDTGRQAVVPPSMLARISRPAEIFFV